MKYAGNSNETSYLEGAGKDEGGCFAGAQVFLDGIPVGLRRINCRAVWENIDSG